MFTIFEKRESQVRSYCRKYPVVFDKARNAEMFSEDGTRYIDFLAVAGSMNYGHNNPEIKKAILDYLSEDRIINALDMYTEAKEDFLQTFEDLILAQGAVQQLLQVFRLQGLQYEDLAAGQQGSDHLKGWILRRGADQDDRTGLDCTKEGVLLRLVETVDLVNKENRRARAGKERLGLRRVNHVADILHPSTHGGKGEELAVQHPGNDPGQGGLADAGRAPENKGRQSARLHHVP